MPTRSGRQRFAQSGMSLIRQTSFTGRAHGTQARVCREAGATVRINTRLRDMNLSVPATDERTIEVLASGLPMNHGAQLAVDITVRSAVTACGRACPNAATVDGSVLTEARRDKERKYTELLQSDWCQLVVVGVEAGGRWSPEAVTFVEGLAASRAREAPDGPFLVFSRVAEEVVPHVFHFLLQGILYEDPMRSTDGAVLDLASLFSACLC